MRGYTKVRFLKNAIRPPFYLAYLAGEEGLVKNAIAKKLISEGVAVKVVAKKEEQTD